jgi:hypothetical protein
MFINGDNRVVVGVWEKDGAARFCRFVGRVVLPILAVCLATLTLTTSSHAQQRVDATFAIQSGVEGADPGIGVFVWQRARTRVAFGADWFTDELMHESIGVLALVEVERSGAFGAEVRYRRWLNDWLGAFAGGTLMIQPESLLGITGGMTAAFPLGKHWAWFGELSASVFPLGTDLPTPEAVLVWGSAGLGVRMRF